VILSRSFGKPQLNRKYQILLAAIILCGAVGSFDFASEASGKGRVIEFGWDTPSIPWLCENATLTECTIAFDGIILDLAQREGQGSLSWIAWSGDEIPSDVQQNAEEDISLLNDANFTRLRVDSFFRLNSSGWNTPPDFFDADFNTVTSNVAFMADAVYQTDLAGIAFDPEDYFSSCWHYPSLEYSGIKTFEQYQVQVRQRGREVAAAIKSACPGRDFVMLFTFANSLPFLSTDWWGHPLSEDTYGLLPAFVDGLLDEACGQIRIIDGLESAYPHMTLAQFQGSVSNYEDGATLSADPSRYLSCVGVGFGTWMDYRSDTFGWYTDPNEFHLNHFTPETFNQAMDISSDLGEYSWVYTQIPDWYLGTVPEAYFDALADVTGLPPIAPCIEFWAPLLRAKDPLPADAAWNVHPNVVLSWEAGIKAASHDVYLGTDVNAVGDANTSETSGVYMGPQEACEYAPVLPLELGQTYYWRIDEVNDVNIWQGDVWSFTVDDGKATYLSPADGSQDNLAHVMLSWLPGIVAASHDVYLGTDIAGVSDANTSSVEFKDNLIVDVNSYVPVGELMLGQTYYWRIDAVNPGYSDSKGDVWSFTVMEYIAVDDMEAYNTSDNMIGDTWLGWWWNWTGSRVELWIDPCVPVHAGAQSMRYLYDNAGGPLGVFHYYSEIVRTFSGPCDWTDSEMKALTLYFYGNAGNDAGVTERMYVGLEDSSSYAQGEYGDNGEDMNDIKIAEWQEWNIRVQDFNDGGVDLSDIRKMYIGFGDRGNLNPGGIPGGSGIVYFDDIRLYPRKCVPWLAKPPADFDNNCFVDFADLAILGSQWLLPPGNPSADIAPDVPDGIVDWLELAILADNWLTAELWPPQ
jgi:hypothetical protein